jgi:hypothetical protein
MSTLIDKKLISQLTALLDKSPIDDDTLEKHKSYVYNDEYLNDEHHLIKNIITLYNDGIIPYKPKMFRSFASLYKNIYSRWKFIVLSCYDESFYAYKFFGMHGITVSEDFLDTKKFCIWCLENNVTSRLGMYTTYIQRKDKTKEYSSDNCFSITEKDIISGKDLYTSLGSLYLAKRYEENHEKTVSYTTAYTRYYVYDMNLEDSLNYPCILYGYSYINNIVFSPRKFYDSVATEKDVSRSTYISRMHYSSNAAHGFTRRPYDMLKPEFSVSDSANSENKLSYKQMYIRRLKEQQKNKAKEYESMSTNDIINHLKEKFPDVYNNKGVDVYSDKDDL